jgi:parallel beta-helix repeat protein
VKWARLYNHVWGGSPPKYGGVNMTFCNANGQCWDTHPNDGIWCPPYTDPPENICEQTQDKGFYMCGYGTHWMYWNVTDYVTPGYNNATIHTNDYGTPYSWDGRVMWMVLVVVFEDPSKPAIRYWVDQGLSKPEYPTIPEAWFNGSINTEANHTLWQLMMLSDDPMSIDFNDCELERFPSGTEDLTKHTVPASCINPADNNRMIWDHESGSMFPALAVLAEQAKEIAKDLIVEEIDVGTPRPNHDFTVTATIKNQGDADVTNLFNVSLYVDDILNSTKQQVSSLHAGSSTPVSFPDVNLPEGCYEFRVFADSDGAITESDDGNNNMTVDGEVGYVIVVDSNSDFVDLLNDPGMPSGSITFDGTTYYIQDLTITNCAGAGITIEDTTVPFVIKSCTVQNCIDCGVYLGNLTNGKINDSVVKNNIGRGIRVQDPTTYVDITNNTVEENTAYGIEVGWASFSSEENPKFINITCNTCYHNTYGIELIGANCTVAGNTVRDNSADGIYVFGNDSKICNNTIEGNTLYGMEVYNSSGNIIYWNDFTNNKGGATPQAYDSGTTNNWNTPTQVDYCYNGGTYHNFTGNYWDDWTSPDSNGDGIVDAPYALAGGAGAVDSYSLVVPWKLCGDVNRDGAVNMGDALATRNHWGFGYPLCNPWAADVNCDGAVNMGDALGVRNHWGFGYPLNCCDDC